MTILRRFCIICTLWLISITSIPYGYAQTTDFAIIYGETRSALFDGDSFTHQWTFTGEARDILHIEVFRIAGQFTPRLRLLDEAGRLITSSETNIFPDTATLFLAEGLPDDGTYQLEVQGLEVNNPADNPAEYSLTLRQNGQRKANVDEGLTPLPNVGTTPLPDLIVDDGVPIETLDILAYGDPITVSKIETATSEDRFTLAGQNFTIIADDTRRISNGILGFSFLGNGVGFIAQHNNLPTPISFFSDQEFEVAYDNVQRVYTITLDDGRIISTDFFRVQSLEVREGVVAAIVIEDETPKRLLFDGALVDLRQVTGRSQTQEQLNIIRLENEQFISTDLEGFDTLAYLGGQLRVLYGDDARFITDLVRVEQLRQNNDLPDQTDLIMDVPINGDVNRTRSLTLTVDWTQFGDITIENDTFRVIPLSQRESTEPLAGLESALFEAQAVRFTRLDGTFRTVLPDGTNIETPLAINADADALPHEDNFAALNFNNLGDDPLPLCPCVESTREVTPVNPANGNFFYDVTDFAVPSHTLQLDLTRYYNSQDIGFTPVYMLDASSGSVPVQLGAGWRHSYQYELDITNAPLGNVKMILPDGAQHIFTETDIPTIYRSESLLSWQIERINGILGTWQATRTDGVIYHFDRAGRLERISETPQRTLTLSPMPSDAPYANLGTGGVIVTEPYGRRLELHIDEMGRLALARDHVGRQVTYTYLGNALNLVDYGAEAQTATYEYGIAITSIEDVRSPYHPTIEIAYDARRRVQRYIENPDDDLTRNMRYSYEENQGNRITTRELVVNSTPRLTTWTMTPRFQIVGLGLPREDFSYEYTYNSVTGTLDSLRQPTLNRYRFEFDERGNLLTLTDPINTVNRHEWAYEQRGAQSLLTEMVYPNGRIDTFVWSDASFAQLVSSTQLVGTENNLPIVRETRYVYDDWGRLAMQVDSGDVATVYRYDDFGYPAAIWEGIELSEGETVADLDNDRARRIVRFDFDSLGQIRAITDGRNNTYTLNWNNATRRLREINGPTGVSIDYRYDEFGRVIDIVDRGQRIAYIYDAAGNILQIEQRDTDTENGSDVIIRTRYTYDEAGNVLSMTDNLDQTTTYEYDLLDNLIRVTTPDERITTYNTFLNAGGDFLWREETDPRGRIFTRRFDSLGRLNRFIIQEGDFSQQFEIEYDTANYPVSIVERSSTRNLELTYNLLGEVLTVEIENEFTRFMYDERGLLASVTTPAERTWAYAYDPLGNLTEVTQPDETIQQYIYDENSNLVAAADPNMLVTSYLYDALNRLTDIEDPLGNRTSYEYDVRGNAISITDPRDVIETATYDVFDRLVSITDGRGDITTYAYDALSRVVDIDEPGSPGRRFTYDTRGNVITVTQRPQEQRTLFSYDGVDRLTSITDPLANTTTFNYSALNRISTVVDAVGNTQRYRYRQGTLFLGSYEAPTVPTADDTIINFTTDALGRVTFIEDRRPEQSRALDTVVEYEDDGYLLRVQTGTDTTRSSGDGDITHQFEYDLNGQPIRYIDPSDQAWGLLYDAGGRLIEVTDSLGRVRRYTYNDASQITQVEKLAPDDFGNLIVYSTETYEYDGAGNIIRYIAPDEVEYQYIYNANNQLAQALLAVGSDVQASYQFEYNGQGQVESIIDPLGVETRYFYTLGDRVARVERDLDAETQLATSYEYDDVGNLRAINLPTLPDSTETPTRISLAYNALNQRVRYVNGANNVWSYTYDAAGNVVQISDPLGSILQYDYDVYNNVTTITYPTDAQVQLTYDESKNLREITMPPNSTEREQTITYRLDVAGNVIEIENGDSVTQYEYDSMGNVQQRITPDGSTTTYEYDGAGQLIRTAYSDGTVIEREYDAAGRLTRVGSLTFTYDALGRVIQATDTQTINYSYDAANNLIERASDIFGTTTYEYDQLYRPVRVALDTVGTNIAYNGRGLPREILRDNGVRTVLNYDAAGRPVSILQFGDDNSRLDGFNYQYNDVGNLIRADRITDGSRTLYSYDVAHRLIEERWLNENGETIYTVSLRYDDAGNRIAETRNGVRTQFLYNEQNQLVGEIRDLPDQNDDLVWFPLGLLLAGVGWQLHRKRWRWIILLVLFIPFGAVYAAIPPFQITANPDIDVLYSYDSNGNLSQIDFINLAEDGTETINSLILEYDPEQRLVEVAGINGTGDAVNTSLSYDALSRLTEWRTGATDAYRVYWDGSQLLGIENDINPNDPPQAFLFNDAAPLLTLQGNEAIWHLNDHLGSTRLYTDEQGTLLDSPMQQLNFGGFGERIFPYNEAIAPDGAAVDTLSLFSNGQLYDPTTDLYYIGLRAYDPNRAIFLQPDPVYQDPFSTLYTYARQRPFAFNDEFGLFVDALLDPTKITDAPQAFRPEVLLPQLDTPDIPEPPAIHERQHDEFFRLLTLVDTLQNGVNDSVAQLSPQLDDLYIITANPLPNVQRDVLAQPYQNLLNTFSAGWSPDLTPNPYVSSEPFSLLNEVQPLLGNAMVRPLAWCFDSGNDLRRSASEIFPSLPLPTPIPPMWAIESSLTDDLQPVPVFAALIPTLDNLALWGVPWPDPTIPNSGVILPDPSVEPAVLNNLDALRATTFDLLRPILPLDITDCDDCVPPLSFSP